MSIELSPAHRAYVVARSPDELEAAAPLDPAKDWRVFESDGWAGLWEHHEAVPELADALAAVVALTGPPGELSADAMAVLLRRALRRTSQASTLVLATQGLERAFAGWLATTRVRYEYRSIPPSRFVRTDAPVDAVAPGLLFRHALFRAAPAVKASCLTQAADAWPDATLTTRAHLVKAFPEEIEWARTLARDWLESTPRRPNAFVLGAVQASRVDFDVVREITLAAGPGSGDLEPLLDGFGEQGARLVLELGAMTKQPHELEKIARALTAWRSDEAAGFLAEHFGKKPVRKHASEYFTRYPALAASALGPIAAGKGRGAAMAQELLDGLARAEAVEAAGGEGEALLEALPSVLVAPPWDGGPRPKRRVIVVPDPPALDGPVAVHGTLPPSPTAWPGRPASRP